MAYMIDARLEQGSPLLILVDAETGEERLHWRGDICGGTQGWKVLFKRLMLLSCADQASLLSRAKYSEFGKECVQCTKCIDE